MIIIPEPHQIEFAEKIWQILRVKGYVYLAGKPRSGKTLTAMLCAEKSTKIKNVLILTTKNAVGYPELKDRYGQVIKDRKGKSKLVTDPSSPKYIKKDEKGWLKFIHNTPTLEHNYHVVNYEQAGTVTIIKESSSGRKLKRPKVVIKLKLNPNDYDLVIIDESHNLGTVGKSSGRKEIIKRICWDLPHIHLSGTAIVESPCSIYHQMSISKFNPFKHSNFYHFHREYGIPYFIEVQGRNVTQYDRHKPELLDKIDEFTVYMTQEDAGISKEFQAVDKLHYIELEKETKKLYNELQDNLVVSVGGYDLVCDTEMKLRTSLHMLESGIAKVDDEYIMLGNTEKIDYIKSTFGDTDDIGIMSHFIGERILLKKMFKNAHIYSSKAHAEGVDLSHLKHFVIISADYSGSKFIQRRDRIINTQGSNTLTVNHILVKNAISDQVYKKTSKKEDFNNKTYERKRI